MPLFQIILIALIQGITEFLPISSSGHLILLPGLPDVSMDSKRSATRSETSQIDSAMARDVPGRPHAPPGDDRSACRHSRALY